MKITRFFHFGSNLKIRTKLLICYSALFILSFMITSFIIYSIARMTILSNIESELLNITFATRNMVKISADVSIKNHLRAIAEKNRDIAAYFYNLSRLGKISEYEAKKQAYQIFLVQSIGTTGYIYCIDSSGKMLHHPKKALIDVNLSGYPFIRTQRNKKEGYVEYHWKNPGETILRPKALYMTYFAPWDWVISVTSYRSEFAELLNISDFKDHILSLKFGKSGYSFLMDSKGELIIHPILEGENIYDAKDTEDRWFIQEMCEKKSGKIIYEWANPGEEKKRRKLVIFNYIAEYDWIVSSSSYYDEFYAPLKTVRQTFTILVIITLILVIYITFQISKSITEPLSDLMKQLFHWNLGCMTPPIQKKSNDEVSLLSSYFKMFLKSINEYSNNLKTEIVVREKAEKEMVLMQHYLKKIIDSMPSAIIGVNLNYKITQFNKEASKMMKINEKHVKTKYLIDIIPQLKILPPMIKEAVDRKAPVKTEKTSMLLDKASMVVDIIVYPIVFNTVKGVIVRIDDVTERVRMEEMMVQTEKMISIGGMAAGIAHEINNPLSGILQSVQNIERRLSCQLKKNIMTAQNYGLDFDKVRYFLKDQKILYLLLSIRNAGERASKTVENMLSFSHNNMKKKNRINLSVLMDKSIELAAHDFDLKKKYDFRNIEIHRDYDHATTPIPCFPAEIEQVMLNLLKNAAQSMEEKTVKFYQPRIVVRIRQTIESTSIEIEDNGSGMNPLIQKRLFEPFYTTKPVGVGTGLGLSVSYFIVTNNHRGSITVASEPGKGSVFKVVLPNDFHHQKDGKKESIRSEKI